MPCTRFYGEPCDPENCCGGRNSKGEPTIRAKRECGGRCGDDLAERVSKVETQLAHILHEIINLREGKDYGERE